MAGIPAPLLAHNRIDANRRNTRLLLLTFAALVLPLAWAVSQFIAPVLVFYTNGFDPAHPFQRDLSAQIVALRLTVNPCRREAVRSGKRERA